MKYITEGIYPERVFKHFEDISRIPRGSGNEKVLSDYIKSFAEDLGLNVIQDCHYNLIVRKPSNKSDSNNTVLLQAHIDMVNEAAEGFNHDFDKDPIQLVVDGNILRANNTTVGADNGIGVAYMMAILENNENPHPELECVFTTSEEVGLVGVSHIDLTNLKSNYVINLDSEEEDYILVGSAGSVDTILSFKKEYKPAIPTNIALEIRVRGLFGGHSGMDIDKNRGNANKIMGRILNSISYDFDIFNMSGGSKRNVIPRNCETTISVSLENLEDIVREIQKTSAKIQKELYPTDPGLKIELRRTAAPEFKVYTDKFKNTVLSVITLIPDGVISMSSKIAGVVETSSNFAVIKETSNSIEFVNLTRSAVQSKKEYVVSIIDRISSVFNGEMKTSSEYPAWEHEINSNLEKISIDIYEKKFGFKPNVAVMHCGLESGILLSKLPHKAEAISIGPNTFDVHTPEEYVEISSIAKIWDYLTDILENL